MACPQQNQPAAAYTYIYGEPTMTVHTGNGRCVWSECSAELRAALVEAFNALNRECGGGVLVWKGVELNWYGSRNCIGSVQAG